MSKARKATRETAGREASHSFALSHPKASLSIVWRYVKSFSSACYNITSRLFWILAVLVVTTILVQGLAQHATVVEPISVPKILADSGYTPEVAGRRLRDAMVQFAGTANTQMKNPQFALHGDLPDIIVPTVGISLDAVVTTMRSLSRSTRSRNITGEFTIKDKLLWLHLRLDGSELYVSPAGVDLEKPDDLLAAAVPKIVEVIQPYFYAVAEHNKDPEHSLEMVTGFIDRLQESDVDVAWLYNLKGNIHREQHNDAEATKAYNKALSLNSGLAVAHLNLGNVYKDHGERDEAIKQYRNAIILDRNFAQPHYNLGLIFNLQGDMDAAVTEYKQAVKIDPKFAPSHYNLGMVYESQKDFDAAIDEFHKSIVLDPKNAQAHNFLGSALAGKGDRDGAIAEYRKALQIDPTYAVAHNNLGDVLTDPKERAAEYREAIRLNPKFGRAYGSLATVLTDPVEKAAANRQALLLTQTGAEVDNDLGVVVTGAGLSRLLGDSVRAN